jgi:signal peptidase II
LIALLVVITVCVAAAAWRTATMLTAMGYALILGGALGNLSDRLLNDGAVFDFLALHLGRIPLFVCNFPDIVITAGVILLFAGLLFEERGAKGVVA